MGGQREGGVLSDLWLIKPPPTSQRIEKEMSKSTNILNLYLWPKAS